METTQFQKLLKLPNVLCARTEGYAKINCALQKGEKMLTI